MYLGVIGLMPKKLFYRAILFTVLILLVVGASLLYAYINVKYSIGAPCAINYFFGIYCPGCGLTRAAVAILNLNFYQAFRYNAFSLIVIPIAFFVVICFLWEWVFKKSSIILKIPTWFLIIGVILFMCYGIVRNFIPYFKPVTVTSFF